MLPFVVLGVGCMIAGLSSFFLTRHMVDKLNTRLSPDQRLSQYFWSFGKYLRFRRAYRDVFPGDPLSVWWEVTMWWGPLVLLLIALTTFILSR